VLGRFWTQNGNPGWPEQRRLFLNLLTEQARLERMARIVGKDALPPRQQRVLLCAELINEAFLRQSAYSVADRFCSAEKQVAMMQLLTRFIELSEDAVERNIGPARLAAMPVLRQLRRMGEEIGEDALERFDRLRQTLEAEFTALLRDKPEDAA
jgi:V/A-type H+-transporting ATPase subunit A